MLKGILKGTLISVKNALFPYRQCNAFTRVGELNTQIRCCRRNGHMGMHKSLHGVEFGHHECYYRKVAR